MGCVSWSEVAEYGCEWRSLSLMIMAPAISTDHDSIDDPPPPQVIEAVFCGEYAPGNVLGQVDEFEHSLFNEDATFIHVCLFRGICM
jgi:hypothetical protein